MHDVFFKVTTSAAVGTAVSISAQLNLLYTALITLAISVVTTLGTEFVKYLVDVVKKKREKLNSHTDEKSDKE